MSSADASCARTRGWLWDYKKLQRRDSKSSSSDEDMSFNFDDSDRSEQSSDGGYASEKDLGTDLVALKVSSSFNTSEPNPRDLHTQTAALNGVPAFFDNRDTATGMPLDDSKEKTAQHKDEHRRKEKDHDKHSKRKEKSKDKLPSKDSKRKKDDADDKKSHEKHRRSEKAQKFDEGEFHKKERHRDRDDERKERHRTGGLDREHFRSSRHDAADEFADHEMHRRERHWDSNRSSHHKGSTKSERDKEGKRVRLDEEQRASNRARSPSPRASKGGKSPSPHNKDEEENDWAGREKDGSSRYRRSGLGGYSPRRRRSDAAIRTPSPPSRSPERKKTRAWDLPPVGMDSGVAAAMAAAHQAAAQQAAALASVSSLVTVNPALAAVSLTQATRNFRRLYIGNVPASVSDGELLEFINAAMLSVHAYHLPGTKPCINCMVNVEKSYAFAEFLTPEDATAGLAFDGITLHGTTLKIRRPRDYIPPPNGGIGIASVLGMVSSVVPDSPQKIFVGGICKTLSAEKVKEIVTAFGQLKAYHWEVTVKNNQMEGFAFLEYLDPSVTLKACAGLNGMRLGNKILTVVQATPNASSEPDGQQTQFYGIPEHAKALLQAPTRILEFQNVISKAETLSLSETEFLEIEQDVRIECTRFGTVKSSHVVKPEGRMDQTTEETNSGDGESAEKLMLQAGEAFMTDVDKKIAEYIASVGGNYFQDGGDLAGGVSETGQTNAEAIGIQASSASNVCIDEAKEVPSSVLPVLLEGEGASLRVESPCTSEKPAEGNDSNNELRNVEQLSTELREPLQPGSEEKAMDLDENVTPFVEQSTSILNADSGTVIGETGVLVGPPPDADMLEAAADAVESLNSQIGDSDLGRVYVEFTREECACKAAHALHGRLYGDRTVTVAYFPLKLYQKRFKKGLEPRTHEERQILALAAQEHLNSFIPDRD